MQNVPRPGLRKIRELNKSSENHPLRRSIRWPKCIQIFLRPREDTSTKIVDEKIPLPKSPSRYLDKQ